MGLDGMGLDGMGLDGIGLDGIRLRHTTNSAGAAPEPCRCPPTTRTDRGDRTSTSNGARPADHPRSAASNTEPGGSLRGKRSNNVR